MIGQSSFIMQKRKSRGVLWWLVVEVALLATLSAFRHVSKLVGRLVDSSSHARAGPPGLRTSW